MSEGDPKFKIQETIKFLELALQTFNGTENNRQAVIEYFYQNLLSLPKFILSMELEANNSIVINNIFGDISMSIQHKPAPDNTHASVNDTHQSHTTDGTHREEAKNATFVWFQKSMEVKMVIQLLENDIYSINLIRTIKKES